ncbi:MAG: type II toxin-antitoxin system prevent-host-death family antitoxin [Alphaproteobacteria bacterium]|nr:type II toxin-antitoxin system prevent-host-death family antitoxin [Alphaproteobacteria bacterium]
MQVNIREARDGLSQLIRAAQAGEDVVIARRGRPVARLVTAGAGPRPTERAGSSQAILGWIRSHPLPGYARRSAEEIDAAITEERGSWR